MTDRIYIFDKINKNRILLGEIQDNFNQSFVIDGTKDTCKVNVYGYTLSSELEPNTIAWHENTNTWWIVSHDKVERYVNEEGYLYFHELSLEGAIELLNVRDLTDCGFNESRYTITQFITRLFSLSNFEYTLGFSAESNNAIAFDKIVDYVKSYQNYTLLSALRDFLSGYNCDAKLSFVYNENLDKLTYAILDIVSKTGNHSDIINGEDFFNDVKEIKTMDKNSFGTITTSNAENVISTQIKTYPISSSVKLSSTTYKIETDTAVIRLPSKVYKGNWIKLHTPLTANITIGSQLPPSQLYTINTDSRASVNNFIDKLISIIESFSHNNPYSPQEGESMIDALEESRDYLVENIYKAGSITYFEGNSINPITGEILQGSNVPYLAKQGPILERKPIIFTDKNTMDVLPNTKQGIYWERGSNLIKGFEFLNDFKRVWGYTLTDYGQEDFVWQSSGLQTVTIQITDSGSYHDLDFKVCSFQINYVPMSDLKVKVDNQKDKLDMQLYNQNGKLTDSRALSKLLNSYSKEISSDSITKYFTTYKLSDIKKVGQRFKINNEVYVVNNLSIDYVQNENGYFIECEYTLSKQFAIKSLMVSPNTNIRDYGIPQNFNVERKQLYRDYYELDYVVDTNADNNPYCFYTETLYFGNTPKDLCSYVGVIKCTYSEPIGGNGDDVLPSDTWYYQLDTTKYELDKMLYVVLTFNDNNIIGYGSQNVYSGFDITRVFTDWIDTINTPISYVDDNGECVGISIMYCDNETITRIYDDFKIETGHGSSDKSIYNFSCFVDEYIYDEAYANAQLRIEENSYNKDAIEVPVFEYVCQIGDSENIFIGDNILQQDTSGDYIYLYQYRYYDAYTRNSHNCVPQYLPTYDPLTGIISCSQGCTISLELYQGNRLQIKSYYSTTYNQQTQEFDEVGENNILTNKDMAIFRHKINKNNGSVVASDLLFVAQNVPSSNVGENILELYLNHWRLK